MPCTGPTPRTELIDRFVDLLFSIENKDSVRFFHLKHIESCANLALSSYYRESPTYNIHRDMDVLIAMVITADNAGVEQTKEAFREVLLKTETDFAALWF